MAIAFPSAELRLLRSLASNRDSASTWRSRCAPTTCLPKTARAERLTDGVLADTDRAAEAGMERGTGFDARGQSIRHDFSGNGAGRIPARLRQVVPQEQIQSNLRKRGRFRAAKAICESALDSDGD